MTATKQAKKRQRRATVAELQKLSPPRLAKSWGVDALKVINLIRSGQLKAIDISSKPGGRPRYLIDKADIAEFERARSITPPAPPTPRRRRSASGTTKEYF